MREVTGGREEEKKLEIQHLCRARWQRQNYTTTGNNSNNYTHIASMYSDFSSRKFIYFDTHEVTTHVLGRAELLSPV